MKIVWSGRAGRDIHRVLQGRENAGPEAADKLIDKVEASAAVLPGYPKLSPPLNREGLRKWPVEGTPLLIFYVTNGRIEIKRLRHAHEDWASEL